MLPTTDLVPKQVGEQCVPHQPRPSLVIRPVEEVGSHFSLEVEASNESSEGEEDPWEVSPENGPVAVLLEVGVD